MRMQCVPGALFRPRIIRAWIRGYMPTMNYSYLYLTELRPIEKCVKLQHFVTERDKIRPEYQKNYCQDANSNNYNIIRGMKESIVFHFVACKYPLRSAKVNVLKVNNHTQLYYLPCSNSCTYRSNYNSWAPFHLSTVTTPDYRCYLTSVL